MHKSTTLRIILSGQAASLNNDFTASKDAKARKLRVKQMKLMNDVCEKMLEVKNVMKDLGGFKLKK